MENGCYSIQITDTGGDGLSFWANNDGTGYANFKGVYAGPPPYAETLRSFPGDFGNETTFNFTVGGINTNTEEPEMFEPKLELFPNPTTGFVTLRMELAYTQDVRISVYDYVGKRVIYKEYDQASMEVIPMDLSNFGVGVYNCTIETDQGIFTEKIVLTK